MDNWFLEARTVAQNALCQRAQCGAVIVANNRIIGSGYNAPPLDDMTNAKCSESGYDREKKSKYDLTCCVHAEWRAITDALKNHLKELQGSTLYYVRLDKEGNIKPSGEPFCTVCSRLALDTGVSQFGLMQNEGPKIFNAKDYNNLSYGYHKK